MKKNGIAMHSYEEKCIAMHSYEEKWNCNAQL